MSKRIEDIEKKFLKRDLPLFKPGDTIKVSYKIKEGDKERLQIFEGVVIKRRRGLTGATFTVRKISHGVGVEKIFPVNSPYIEKIEVVNRGRVRRANLSYIRTKIGKSAKIKELTEDVLEKNTEPPEAHSDTNTNKA